MFAYHIYNAQLKYSSGRVFVNFHFSVKTSIYSKQINKGGEFVCLFEHSDKKGHLKLSQDREIFEKSDVEI